MKGLNRILIACAGLGMGNASRMLALVEALVERAWLENRQLEIQIASWGRGYQFLLEYQKHCDIEFEVLELRPLWKNGTRWLRVPTLWRTLKAFVGNCILLQRQVRRHQPDLIVLDSDYHFPAFILSRVPVVFMGQAVDVVRRARDWHWRAPSWKAAFQFFFCERVDSWLQKFFSDLVLIPVLTPKSTTNSKLKEIPLLVRQEFISQPLCQHLSGSNGLMLSGSEIDRHKFLKLAQQFSLNAPAMNHRPGAVFITHAWMLDGMDLIVTQGGLSSISEGIARRKFLIVFPLPNHAEQFLNAIAVERLGLGIMGREEDFKAFPQLLQRALKQRALNHSSQVNCHGATVAAQVLGAFFSGTEFDLDQLYASSNRLLFG